MQELDNISINFILSTARTGSTLLSSMLNMHSNIISTAEEPFAINLYKHYHSVKNWDTNIIEEYCNDFILFSDGILDLQFGSKQQLYESLMKNQKHLNFERVIKLTYLAFIPEKNKKSIRTIVDKHIKPDLLIKNILNYYPKSKIIILYRDPRDNALIKYKFNSRKGEKTDYLFFALNWNRIYSSLYNEYIKYGESKFLPVKYEDLVSQPEIELKKICNFIDVGYNKSMLEYHISVNEKLKDDSLSSEQKKEFNNIHLGLTQKINTDKIGIWKKEMNLSDANLIWDICGELATKIGYEKHVGFIPTKKNITFYIKKTERIFYTTIYKLYYYWLPYFIRKIIKKNKC